MSRTVVNSNEWQGGGLSTPADPQLERESVYPQRAVYRQDVPTLRFKIFHQRTDALS